MSGDSLYRRLETVLSCVAAYALLQRILRGNYEVDAIGPCFFCHMLHDSHMTYMQGVERAAIYCYILSCH